MYGCRNPLLKQAHVALLAVPAVAQDGEGASR